MSDIQDMEASICGAMEGIPDVYDVWRFIEDGTRIYIMVLGSQLYNRDTNMKVYECEYTLCKVYPNIDICFHCIPVRLWVGGDFLPSDAERIWQR